MPSHKLEIAISSILAVLIIPVIGYVAWHTMHPSIHFGMTGQPTAYQQAVSEPLSSSKAGASQTQGTGSGITVLPAPAISSAGQIGQSGTNQTPASSPSGSSSIDPSTFSQFDKYKDSTTALFADVQVGNGADLKTGQQADVLYKGWLTNGQLFDKNPTDSNGNEQPFSFTLGAHQVIAGWEEAIYGMKVGGTRLLIIPPATGYGSTTHGPIPADSVLVFEVQLLSAH